MNRKIISILSIFVIISVVVLPSFYCQNLKSQNSTLLNSKISTISDDVPIWNVGDKWTYKIKNLNLDWEEEGEIVHVHASVDKIPLEVIDDTEESYTVDFKTAMAGDWNIDLNLGGKIPPIRLSGRLLRTSLAGEIVVDKDTLGIKQVDAQIKGIMIIYAIPIPFKINTNLEFDKPVTLLEFPLEIGNYCAHSSTNMAINGELTSFWLKVLNFVNKIALLFGKEFIPSNLSSLLPDIDLKNALKIITGNETFEVGGLNNIAVVNKEDITVPAGTFNCYRISLMDPTGIPAGVLDMYYSPQVGNIVNMSVIGYFDMELIDTNYI